MKIAWLLGWAVPAEWFVAEASRVWPQARHVAVPAAPDWRVRLAAHGDADAVGGYSLGALLLLTEPVWVATRWPRVGLIAPIWTFPSEAGRGGRVARAQVKALARWVRRDEGAARADFYAHAGLRDVRGMVEASETLIWGLEQLETCAAAPGLPPGWRAYAGERDPLLDAAAQAREAAGLRIVPGAGHAPAELVAAWAEDLRA